MKALLLAGGKGTRLQPLTYKLPKPMVPIVGRPLLERIILNLKSSGIEEVVISTCYKSQYIKNYFKEGQDLGVKIHYVSEATPLGTGGAIKNAEKFFDDTFVVLNSDIVSDVNYRDLIEYHRSKNAIATISMTSVDNPSQYGVIEFDKDNYIKSFKEKPKPGETDSHWINAGVYVFEPEIFGEIPGKKVVSVERDTYPALLQKGYKMAAYQFYGYWLDIGTLEKYTKAHKDVLSGKCNFCRFSDKIKESGDRVIVEKGAEVHPQAEIIGPVYIGENAVVKSGARVGPYTVIGNNSIVSENSKVIGSILWDNVIVSEGAEVVSSVVVSDCCIDSNSRIFHTAYTNDVYTEGLQLI
ncbi:sugar phosphate nucleotidyltransferase [Caldanaerobius polysaccharolyticus]|uniref:sugar phosphate nucleotidyltransferase n=1 Tax=Caldanaerobius polysaccharolyticus TaxID=44256 RepID=UPI00047DFDAA